MRGSTRAEKSRCLKQQLKTAITDARTAHLAAGESVPAVFANTHCRWARVRCCKSAARRRSSSRGKRRGAELHQTGIPFNDPSGERLRAWMDIDRKTFYDHKKIALLPMGFRYPGTGPHGDLPPRAECTATWREALLANLPALQLTVVIGQYAQAYHLQSGRQSVTDTVRLWKTYWPEQIPLPHPSPRNQMWVKKNPWFTRGVLPVLRKRVHALL